MLKIVFATFFSFLFIGSLSAQQTPYKGDSGLRNVSVIEDDQHNRFYADQRGNIFGKKTFSLALAFGCGYAPVQQVGANNETWSYIEDKNGTTVTTFDYVREAGSFKPDGQGRCKATLWNVVSSKYQGKGCGDAVICDCALIAQRNSSGSYDLLDKDVKCKSRI